MNKKLEESSLISGNFEDKYHSENIIAKILMDNFIQYYQKILTSLPMQPIPKICEIGCGEGELLLITRKVFVSADLYATDLSEEVIEIATQKCSGMSISFSIQNAEKLSGYSDGFFDLVICSEVLEHLENPYLGLNEISRISKKFILVSVPNEPIWRILNLLRGKYIRSCGNTPGHLNHWDMIRFEKFLKNNPGVSIIRKIYPFPWQMILLEKNL